jgi:hypothetical protein
VGPGHDADGDLDGGREAAHRAGIDKLAPHIGVVAELELLWALPLDRRFSTSALALEEAGTDARAVHRARLAG